MINKETIDRICDMARLEISENDKDKFVGQMNDILGYVDRDAEKWYASWSINKDDGKVYMKENIQNVDIYKGLFDL